MLRLAGRVALVALSFGLVAIGAFALAACQAVPQFHPITTPIPADTAAWIRKIPNYARDEDATYLTFVEWYLVFNPQEYADYISHHRPSGFPYFRGIGQMWRGYANVYGLTRRYYPFNPGYNLMLVVITSSSTVEFGIKGAYEKTIGRMSEWTAGGARTAEDELAARVARDYGDFIPTRPWFEFPFGRAFRDVWTTTGFFGPHMIRKTERKLFLSLEYGVKTLYAGVIRIASHAVYGVADTEVYLSAHDITPALLRQTGVRGVAPLGPGRWIITVPHYQGFTDKVPNLAEAGVNFEEVAGNNEIMLTMVAPSDWHYDLPAGQPLFEMPLLNSAQFKRVAVQVPVTRLGAVLREMAAKRLRLEHLYDY